MIYLTSDHGGYNLKNEIARFLKDNGAEVTDLGPLTMDETDDYPDYTLKLIQKLREDSKMNKGIIICRNGVGVSMLANKFRGIRAVLSWNPEHAASSRRDDDTNVLALPADYISTEEGIKITANWLSTDFSNLERHNKRLDIVREFGQ